MKKTHKRMLGLFGLSLVAMMTVVAATMPTPGVLAVASPSAVDTITVVVVGNAPRGDIVSPENDAVVTNPTQRLVVNYEKVKEITVYIKYIDDDGQTTGDHIVYHQADLNLENGTIEQNLVLGAGGFGYGRYIVSVVGKDEEDTEVPLDQVALTFLPIKAQAVQNEDDGLVDLRITDYEDDVESIDVYLDGVKIATIPKQNLDKVTKLDFGDRESGTYELQLKARYADGSSVDVPESVEVEFDSGFVPHTDVPDTGRFFQNLNISKEDYLVTGLIMFFVLGIVAFGIVTSNRKSTNQRKRR